VCLYHDHLLGKEVAVHARCATRPGLRRRVFAARTLGDNARHAHCPWRTSPPFPGLELPQT